MLRQTPGHQQPLLAPHQHQQAEAGCPALQQRDHYQPPGSPFSRIAAVARASATASAGPPLASPNARRQPSTAAARPPSARVNAAANLSAARAEISRIRAERNTRISADIGLGNYRCLGCRRPFSSLLHLHQACPIYLSCTQSDEQPDKQGCEASSIYSAVLFAGPLCCSPELCACKGSCSLPNLTLLVYI